VVFRRLAAEQVPHESPAMSRKTDRQPQRWISRRSPRHAAAPPAAVHAPAVECRASTGLRAHGPPASISSVRAAWAMALGLYLARLGFRVSGADDGGIRPCASSWGRGVCPHGAARCRTTVQLVVYSSAVAVAHDSRPPGAARGLPQVRRARCWQVVKGKNSSRSRVDGKTTTTGYVITALQRAQFRAAGPRGLFNDDVLPPRRPAPATGSVARSTRCGTIGRSARK